MINLRQQKKSNRLFANIFRSSVFLGESFFVGFIRNEHIQHVHTTITFYCYLSLK